MLKLGFTYEYTRKINLGTTSLNNDTIEMTAIEDYTHIKRFFMRPQNPIVN